jgi:hypothetical protein
LYERLKSGRASKFAARRRSRIDWAGSMRPRWSGSAAAVHRDYGFGSTRKSRICPNLDSITKFHRRKKISPDADRMCAPNRDIVDDRPPVCAE